MNLKYVTSIGGNNFEGDSSVSKYVLNSDMTGEIGFETFKQNTKLGELEIPAGITKLGEKVFNETNYLARLIICGKDTELKASTFTGMKAYPRIVGYVGSKAEAFAKANGFTFINIETDEEIHKGDKPLAEPYYGEIEEPFIPVFEEFDPTGATAYGHMTGYWNLEHIVDTYWAYYADTKTLKLVSARKSYNETGSSKYFDDKVGWQDYVGEIEHLVIGDYIDKFSDALCAGMVNLKDVEMSRSVNQMNTMIFDGCENLTTIYYRGRTRVEGVADFTGMKLENSIQRTAIKVLKLGELNENLDDILLPGSLETIITPHFNDTFDQFCKENMYDLQDARNPENIKAYCIRVELDPDWPMCGDRAAYEFDAATGTLTVHGVGAIKNVDNYYGGGSKFQPWFEIRDQIKHVIITEHITTIGKYAFTECVNLETVRLPKREKIVILNAAFEKCYKLKSIYIDGNEPIEGTLDLSIVHDSILAWSFAYDYLIANVIVDESVRKIGKTAFEENLGLNLKGIYGVPGSFAETYAEKNGLTFYDISKGLPTPVTCIPPESTDTDDVGGDDIGVVGPNNSQPEREYNIIHIEDLPSGLDDVPDAVEYDTNNTALIVIIIIIVVAVVVIAASGIGIFITLKKGSGK